MKGLTTKSSATAATQRHGVSTTPTSYQCQDREEFKRFIHHGVSMNLRLATANENGRSGVEFSLQAEPSPNASREVGTSAFGLACLRAG